MRVYSGWRQPQQPLVVMRIALSVRRPFDQLWPPCGRDWPRALQPIASKPSSASNGHAIAAQGFVSRMSCARRPRLAAIAAANSVAAAHHDDSQWARSVLRCAVPDTSE